MSARIQASSSALQLEKNLLYAKEHRLQDLLAQYQTQEVEGQASSSTAMLPSARLPALDMTDPSLGRSEFTNMRKLHFQVQRLCPTKARKMD